MMVVGGYVMIEPGGLRLRWSTERGICSLLALLCCLRMCCRCARTASCHEVMGNALQCCFCCFHICKWVDGNDKVLFNSFDRCALPGHCESLLSNCAHATCWDFSWLLAFTTLENLVSERREHPPQMQIPPLGVSPPLSFLTCHT